MHHSGKENSENDSLHWISASLEHIYMLYMSYVLYICHFFSCIYFSCEYIDTMGQNARFLVELSVHSHFPNQSHDCGDNWGPIVWAAETIYNISENAALQSCSQASKIHVNTIHAKLLLLVQCYFINKSNVYILTRIKHIITCIAIYYVHMTNQMFPGTRVKTVA